ncbi:MAG: hypothetical protein Q4C28_12675 [Escherichia coli]|nr:hypothetical protein [Escherichia coli]
MAKNNTTDNFASMEFPMAFSRQDSFPLDKTSVYGSLADAQTYAQTSPLAYVGQILSVVVDGVSTAYQIKNTAGDLEALGASAVSVAPDSDVTEMLEDVFGPDEAGA